MNTLSEKLSSTSIKLDINVAFIKHQEEEKTYREPLILSNYCNSLSVFSSITNMYDLVHNGFAIIVLYTLMYFY